MLKSRKAQINFIDLWKAGLLIIFGIIFLSALAPNISKEFVSSIANLGVTLIIIGVIIAFIYPLLRFLRIF